MRWFAAVVLAVAGASNAAAQDLNLLQEEAVSRVQAYLRVNTINPPGNEQRAVDFFVQIIGDPSIEIETIMAFSPAVPSTDTDVYRTIAQVVRQHHANAVVLPAVQAGFTDSHFFRDLGSPSYGFAPVLIPPEDAGGVHGYNERISVENVRRGTAIMLEIVQAVVY